MNLKKKFNILLVLFLGISMILVYLLTRSSVSQKALPFPEVLAQIACICTVRSGPEALTSDATCAADEILITGGCQGILGATPSASFPIANGWRCFGGQVGISMMDVIAHAWCCK